MYIRVLGSSSEILVIQIVKFEEIESFKHKIYEVKKRSHWLAILINLASKMACATKWPCAISHESILWILRFMRDSYLLNIIWKFHVHSSTSSWDIRWYEKLSFSDKFFFQYCTLSSCIMSNVLVWLGQVITVCDACVPSIYLSVMMIHAPRHSTISYYFITCWKDGQNRSSCCFSMNIIV